MSAAICGLCGQAATGLASINDTRYCHGDDIEPTCYERALINDGIGKPTRDRLIADIFGTKTPALPTYTPTEAADDTARDHDDERDADLSDHGDL